MDEKYIGQLIKESRNSLGLTQAQLADKCRLSIRTIQRIESGTVSPRFYTINLINEALGTRFKVSKDVEEEKQLLNKHREVFRRRKTYRIITFSSALVLMLAIVILAFPTWELFGMSKMVWAPFFYLIMFAHLIGIGIMWRCPSCNGLLGDVFNTRFCSKCGLQFYD